MKTYVRLSCTDCNRTKDQHIDLHHYTPDKCTITLGCYGRLFPVDTRSNPTIAVTPITGIKDWVPRNGYNVRPAVTTFKKRGLEIDNGDVLSTESNTLSLLTGSLGQMVIAVTPRPGGVLPPYLDISFEVADDTPKDYRAYVYRFSTGIFTTVSGKESGLSGKVLRYNATGTSPDVVEVRVNGVLRSQGTGPDEYQIYTSPTSPVPPNTILFNTAIDPAGMTQVDVVVTKTSAALVSVVRFTKHTNDDESRSGTGAYENVNGVKRFEGGLWVDYELYTADISSSGLKINTIMVPALVQQSSHLIDYAKTFFVLAARPYKHVDRYYTVVAPFTGFDFAKSQVVKYSSDSQSDVNTITASFNALSGIFPPLVMDLFESEQPILTGLGGVSEQTTVDGGVIVGPDK